MTTALLVKTLKFPHRIYHLTVSYWATQSFDIDSEYHLVPFAFAKVFDKVCLIVYCHYCLMMGKTD